MQIPAYAQEVYLTDINVRNIKEEYTQLEEHTTDCQRRNQNYNTLQVSS